MLMRRIMEHSKVNPSSNNNNSSSSNEMDILLDKREAVEFFLNNLPIYVELLPGLELQTRGMGELLKAKLDPLTLEIKQHALLNQRRCWSLQCNSGLNHYNWNQQKHMDAKEYAKIKYDLEECSNYYILNSRSLIKESTETLQFLNNLETMNDVNQKMLEMFSLKHDNHIPSLTKCISGHISASILKDLILFRYVGMATSLIFHSVMKRQVCITFDENDTDIVERFKDIWEKNGMKCEQMSEEEITTVTGTTCKSSSSSFNTVDDNDAVFHHVSTDKKKSIRIKITW